MEKNNNIDDIGKELKKKKNALNELEDSEIIKSYEALKLEVLNLSETFQELEFSSQIEAIRDCDHLFFTEIYKEFDGHRTDTFEFYTCVKCALSDKYKMYDLAHKANRLQQQMPELYNKATKKTFFKPDCDLPLAVAICQGIISEKPDISNEQIMDYFQSAIYNISTKKVTDDVSEKRNKRLIKYAVGLNGFNIRHANCLLTGSLLDSVGRQ